VFWFLIPIAVVTAAAFLWRRTVQVPCSIDLEATHDHFHAHVELDGVVPHPGDAVQVEQAPSRIPFGEKRRLASRARVQQASRLRRAWTRLVGALQLQDLYDVGFE
jgi:hypothetical protein